MKKTISKEEMEFTLNLIKNACDNFISSIDEELCDEPYNNGVKFCCGVILEKIHKLEKGKYQFIKINK